MKFAFVYNFEKSDWKSCEIISSNLLKAYNHFLGKNQTKSFCLSDQFKKFHKLNLANEIYDFNPTHIVILDHKPHPLELFSYLKMKYLKHAINKRPEIIIHVFGDFTLYGKNWIESEEFLRHFKIKFVCASDRQVDLISRFVNDSQVVHKCPFPVDEKDFSYNEKLRNNVRKFLGITKEQVVYLYTGRISLQKKVFELTFDFAQFLKITKSNAYLYIAGNYDDLGNPFVGIHTKHGEFCQRHMLLLDSLPEEIRSRIIYVGNLSQKNLLDYYNAADFYISMSTHNDEDYGMSPAEALCTGLPAILTDWAGYASFSHGEKNAVSLIPVEYKATTGIGYNSISLVKELIRTVGLQVFNNKKRVKYSKYNLTHFSITGNISTIQKIVSSKIGLFDGFSDLLKKYSEAYEGENPPFATFNYEIVYTDLYKEVYASYLSENF